MIQQPDRHLNGKKPIPCKMHSTLKYLQRTFTNEQKGSCLCGKIKYTLTQTPHPIIACHCTHCQYQTGSPFSLVGDIPTISLQLPQTPIFQTTTTTADSGNKVYRKFCGECGSPVVSFLEKDSERCFVKMGTVEVLGEVKVDCQIWLRSRVKGVKLVAEDGKEIPGSMKQEILEKFG